MIPSFKGLSFWMEEEKNQLGFSVEASARRKWAVNRSCLRAAETLVIRRLMSLIPTSPEVRKGPAYWDGRSPLHPTWVL